VMASFNFNPKVIAHRGASAYAPENTMSAFVKAAQLGVRWIEFDLMQAACGEPIVFHDDTLDRTTNGSGLVMDYPYHYLRCLDAGSWFDPRFAGEKIPTLRHIIDYLTDNKMAANIEIKTLPGHEEALIKRMLQELDTYLKTNQAPILFSSFSITALEILRQYSKTCLIGLLMHEWLSDWQMICDDLQCATVNVNQELMTDKIAHKIIDSGRKLLCYTVNDPLRAKELYAFGTDAVFSDVPDILLSIV
jgi:glycerophosphoryl diester phosphodiesterase